MGIPPERHFRLAPGLERYCCTLCGCDLLLPQLVQLDRFTGLLGLALFVDLALLVNVAFCPLRRTVLEEGDKVVALDTGVTVKEVRMQTGRYQVADIECGMCKRRIGFKYLRALSSSERHKEGKCLVERELVAVVKGQSRPSKRYSEWVGVGEDIEEVDTAGDVGPGEVEPRGSQWSDSWRAIFSYAELDWQAPLARAQSFGRDDDSGSFVLAVYRGLRRGETWVERQMRGSGGRTWLDGDLWLDGED